ncbi:MAG: hypothetical protein GXP08_03070 [Gammaproteobacteria bacterium]|nr:hypothetical protein [Gammaproteobacteria bacterium]
MKTSQLITLILSQFTTGTRNILRGKHGSRMSISGLSSCLLLTVSTITLAETFNHDFEGLEQNRISTFTLTDGNLSAEFVDGTAVAAGVASLYRSGTQSWVVNPMGSSPQGMSAGSGTITFSVFAKRMVLFFRNENATMTSTLRVIDEHDGIIQDFSGTDADWLEVNITRNDGDALIKSIELINDGPAGMAVIDDLMFSTTAAPNNSGSPASGGGGGDSGNNDDDGGGGVFPYFLLVLLSIVLWRGKEYRQNVSTQ